jgi:nucleoside-diphosphate-sugar epimerase
MTPPPGLDAVILGHTGFLGRALFRHMADCGDRVRGLSSTEADLRDPSALSVVGDLLSRSSTVIVAAAITPDRGKGLVQYFDHTTILKNVARLLEDRPVERLIYVSTDALYSTPKEGLLISETSPTACDDLYTLAKYVGEGLFAHVARERGFGLLTVRLVPLFGPEDPHNSYGPNRFVRSIAEGRSVDLFGDGEELRDHLFVLDAAEAIRQLALSGATGVVNLASGASRSFASVVDELVAVCPFPITVSHRPRQTPVTHRRFSNDRFRSLVPGFRPTAFEAALRLTLDRALRVDQ